MKFQDHASLQAKCQSAQYTSSDMVHRKKVKPGMFLIYAEKLSPVKTDQDWIKVKLTRNPPQTDQ